MHRHQNLHSYTVYVPCFVLLIISAHDRYYRRRHSAHTFHHMPHTPNPFVVNEREQLQFVCAEIGDSTIQCSTLLQQLFLTINKATAAAANWVRVCVFTFYYYFFYRHLSKNGRYAMTHTHTQLTSSPSALIYLHLFGNIYLMLRGNICYEFRSGNR